jgi:hypothetical protein
VAYSAGADSTALLLAAHQRWPGQVVAMHVHHGLHTFHPQFNAVLFAEVPSMGFEPVGRGLQAVVHMQCHHPAGPPLMRCEQQGR